MSQYADDLTQAFPDVLGLARGLDQTEAVAEAILFIRSFSDFLTDLVEPWSVSLR